MHAIKADHSWACPRIETDIKHFFKNLLNLKYCSILHRKMWIFGDIWNIGRNFDARAMNYFFSRSHCKCESFCIVRFFSDLPNISNLFVDLNTTNPYYRKCRNFDWEHSWWRAFEIFFFFWSSTWKYTFWVICFFCYTPVDFYVLWVDLNRVPDLKLTKKG